MENLNFDYDLVIVGGGIVGTTLACALQHSGLKIAIIETQTLEKAASRKQAYALSLLSGQILTQIGVWEDIFPTLGKFKRIRLSDANHQGIVKFETSDLDTNYLGYVGEHHFILKALQNFTYQSKYVWWFTSTQVTDVIYQDSFAVVKVNTNNQKKSLQTRLVIGADGANSYIRQQAGITSQGWKYWQSCVTFTIKHSAPQNDIAFERFWETGPMGILPLPGNRCQIVWSAPHTIAHNLQSMSKEEFMDRLAQHTEGLFSDLELVSERFLFPVELKQSNNYVKPRLALVGDAAHRCHPVGGQGLNLGIRDVGALAQVLQIAYKQGEDIGSLEVLKRYENWRKTENLTILGFTDFLTRSFSNNFLPLVAIRRMGLWLLRQVKPLKIFALKLMTGLRGRKPILNT